MKLLNMKCVAPGVVFTMFLAVTAFAAVNTDQIVDNAVTTPKLADNAVTTPKIADGSVTASKLGLVCPDWYYLQYTALTGWTCSIGTAGPQGPVGPQGPAGPQGEQGPAGVTPKYANIIVVAKSGGDFSDPVSAINSITDASASKTYLVKIMPGVYEIPWSTMRAKSFVDIEGSGAMVTKIRSVNSCCQGGAGTVYYYNVTDSELRNITIEIEGTTAPGVEATAVPVSGGSPRFSNVRLNVIGSGNNYGLKLNSSKAVLRNVDITMSGNILGGYGAWVFGTTPVLFENITVEGLNGSNVDGIIAHGGTAEIRNLRIVVSGGGQIPYGISSQTDGGSWVPSSVTLYNSSVGTVYVDSTSVFKGANVQVDSVRHGTDGSGASGTFQCVNCFDSNFNPSTLQ